MNPFDGKLCISNIYALAKRHGIQIKDLEAQSGVSRGYLSLCKKNNAAPRLEALLLIADKFGVTVDFLARYTISDITPDEQLLLELIQKISEDLDSWENFETPVMFEEGIKQDFRRNAYWLKLNDHAGVAIIPIIREQTTIPYASCSTPAICLLPVDSKLSASVHFIASDSLRDFLSEKLLRLYQDVKDAKSCATGLLLDDDTRAIIDELIKDFA